jgi:hypothetical protein
MILFFEFFGKKTELFTNFNCDFGIFASALMKVIYAAKLSIEGERKCCLKETLLIIKQRFLIFLSD